MACLRFASVGLRIHLGPRLRPTMRGPQVMAQAAMSSNSLGKSEIVEIVAQKAGVSKDTAKSVVDAFTDTVINAVAKGEWVFPWLPPLPPHFLLLTAPSPCGLFMSNRIHYLSPPLQTKRWLWWALAASSAPCVPLVKVATPQQVSTIQPGLGPLLKPPSLQSIIPSSFPTPGAEIDIPEKAAPSFKAGKQFKDTVAAAHK
jgi:nucleoid DNA-binding protein